MIVAAFAGRKSQEWCLMLKSVFVAGLFVTTLYSPAFAACTAEDSMTKASDISEVLVPKLSTKPDEASKIMSEMGDATGTGTVTAATCTKLDALLVRAKKL
jgi:hypothetical protein